MKPVLFESTATRYNTQGIGTLDCISCVVTEERNGIFELEMKVSVEAPHYDDCVEGNIIVAIHDDTKTRQPFQIYKRSKPINGVVTVNAEHISYRLGMIVTAPFESSNVGDALQKLKTNAVEDCPFEFWTDKVSEGTFKVEQPASIRSKLGGEQGSILDAFGGGEYKWDNFTVRLYKDRGNDNGVTLRKGKNITDYTKQTDMSGVYTGIVPYFVDGDDIMMLPEKVVRLDGAAAGRTVAVDLSNKFERRPSVEQMREAAIAYVNANAKSSADVNGKVSFVALWQTEEYKNVAPLQRVNLCDIVTVVFDKGDEIKTKVIKTVYNVMLERYDEIELGESRTNMTTAIKAITENVQDDDVTKSQLKKALEHAADLITGGLGGHVVINRNADGQPNEILIMDTDDKETAVNVIRMNMGGIAFSQNGYNGPFNTAWTIDSHFVADFITTGTLNAAMVNVTNINASNIKTGTLASQDGLLKIRMNDGGRGVEVSNQNGGYSRIYGSGIQTYDIKGNLRSTYLRSSAQIVGATNTIAVSMDGALRVNNQNGEVSSAIYGNVSFGSGNAYFYGNVYNSAGGVQFVSDRNKKNTILTLAVEKAKDFIFGLLPRTFKYNDGTSGRTHHGFIAQEVSDAMSEDWGVYTEWEEDGKKTCGIRYDEIIADLVAVVQDQERRIRALEGVL